MLLLLSILSAVALGQRHDEWQHVLDKHRSKTGRVDYKNLGQDEGLGRYLHSLSSYAEPTSRAEQLAFWINAYNALTVKLVSDHWPIASIKELDDGQVWDTRTFSVARQTLTLNQIERQKLMSLGEPRIHVALNCASLGCPPLHKDAFSAETIEQQLHEVSSAWISSTGIEIDPSSQHLKLSTLFDWYASDFIVSDGLTVSGVKSKLQGPIRWVSQYTTQKQKEWLLRGNYTISFIPYSWDINATE
jgi:hypothetical protein